MQELVKDAANEVADLLIRFSFDLDGLILDQWVDSWFATYPASWVRFSVVEALYQGRYKAFSIDQILRFWQRRGQPLHHFNHEFERIIRGRFSQSGLISAAKFVKADLNVAQRSHPSPEPPSAAETAEERLEEPSVTPELAPVEPLPAESGLPAVIPAGLPAAGLETDSNPEEADLEADSLEENGLKVFSIQSFRPFATDLESSVPPKWTKVAIGKFTPKSIKSVSRAVEPIDQFVPAANAPPEFYSKLKAVVSTAIVIDRPSSQG